jgi:glucosamine 6-phosphate synthetase-like amidotransferase/phosphosugar isomerase protein
MQYQGDDIVCGIFGFAVKKHVPLAEVFKILEKLEVHRYPEEPNPVGGFGAGIAILNDDGKVDLEKTGKVGEDSPAKRLSRLVKIGAASVLVGHVRFPSKEFWETAKFRETAQPYVARCYSGLTVVSAHNGYVANYEEIRRQLGEGHMFESGSVGIIDSDVIPHFFEEMLMEKTRVNDALEATFKGLEGSNVASLLHTGTEGSSLHFIYKGKGRGLTVWSNEQGETVFCSRKEPLLAEFNDFLVQGKFKEKVSVRWQEEANLKLTFPIDF